MKHPLANPAKPLRVTVRLVNANLETTGDRPAAQLAVEMRFGDEAPAVSVHVIVTHERPFLLDLTQGLQNIVGDLFRRHLAPCPN